MKRSITNVSPVVSPEEMLKHKSQKDAWIAIRGNVYNVTDYIPSHPGGQEIMRGVGLQDATDLFDEIHPWVNYDTILKGHYVGRMAASGGGSSNKNGTTKVRLISPKMSSAAISAQIYDGRYNLRHIIDVNLNRQVRYELLQQLDVLLLNFFVGAYTNPFLDVRRPFDKKWTFVITFAETVFTYRFAPPAALVWPPLFTVFHELGKIEIGFEKAMKRQWPSAGDLDVLRRKVLSQQCKRKYVIKEKVHINKYTFLLTVAKADLSICNTPLGYDILIYNDQNEGRLYTPIPHFYISKTNDMESFTSPMITFVIRRYPDGRLSNYLYNKKVGDVILGTDPVGTFDLQIISDRKNFLFIAGGVGVASFLPIIRFLMEKRLRPVSTILLLLFNRSIEFCFLEHKYSALTKDERFRFYSILTRPHADYVGIVGHVSVDLLITLLHRAFPHVSLTDEFIFVSGPSGLQHVCFEELQALSIAPYNVYFFSALQEQKITPEDPVDVS